MLKAHVEYLQDLVTLSPSVSEKTDGRLTIGKLYSSFGFFFPPESHQALVLTQVSWARLSSSSSWDKHCRRLTRAAYLHMPLGGCFSFLFLFVWSDRNLSVMGNALGFLPQEPSWDASSCISLPYRLLPVTIASAMVTLPLALVYIDRSHDWGFCCFSFFFPVSIASVTMYNPTRGICPYQKMLISGFYTMNTNGKKEP